MSMLADEVSRNDILNRLKRAEGQLCGVQRMVEQGDTCLDIAAQMAAVRKALYSTCARMTVCFMQQELLLRLSLPESRTEQLGGVRDDVQAWLAKIR